jgi:hypothetical protein
MLRGVAGTRRRIFEAARDFLELAVCERCLVLDLCAGAELDLVAFLWDADGFLDEVVAPAWLVWGPPDAVNSPPPQSRENDSTAANQTKLFLTNILHTPTGACGL